MADLTQLGQAAYDSQPVYYTDEKMAWEQRLGLAYDEAVAHIRAAMAPGTTINLSDYELAANVAGSQMASKADPWTAAFKTEKDPAQVNGIRFENSKSKDYYLGHFAQASANLGAFITGYAREQIVLGALTQAEFNKSCDLRLRALSDIIYLGRTGSLPAILNPSSVSDGPIIVGTPGIYTPDSAPPALGSAGVIVAIVVVGVLIGAGIGVAMVMSAENAKQRRIALEICQDAVRRGNPKATEICGTMRGVVDDLSAKAGLLDNLIPRDIQKQVVTYGAIGLGALAVIQFGPQIMESIMKTRDVHAREKVRQLRSLEEAYG